MSTNNKSTSVSANKPAALSATNVKAEKAAYGILHQLKEYSPSEQNIILKEVIKKISEKRGADFALAQKAHAATLKELEDFKAINNAHAMSTPGGIQA